jgi:hypothetical protein
MSDKIYMSTCGSKITEAHYHRNVARELVSSAHHLMSKNKTLSAQGKAEQLFKAYSALNKAVAALVDALKATPEGRDLLMNSEYVPAPEANIEKVAHNVTTREQDALVAAAEAIALRQASVQADTL